MKTPNELSVSSHLDNLAAIATFITKAAEQAGLDERAVYAVQMAVDEACTNIIQHAYEDEATGDIRLVYDVQPDGLQITIYDQSGTIFDPAQVPELNTEASLEERRLGGMGLFFVYNLMDRVEFNFDTPDGNQLILFKQREPA